MRIPFGKHKGQRVTRLPIDYLEWLINENTQYAAIAKAELERRGIPDGRRKIEISNHAIDRASLRVLEIWKKEHKAGEGIHAWLARISIEALKTILGDNNLPLTFEIEYSDMVLAFKRGQLYPTLTTVMKNEKDNNH